ncbi:hypothetical protein FB446DRAFT_755387 [Lentinula raphanica]|nr:hypothetical protein FB446DRAFT_755387 [Lentinula raphanica]
MVHLKSKLFLVLLAANMASVLAAPAPASSGEGFEIKSPQGSAGSFGADILKSRPLDFDITNYRAGNPTTGKSTKAAEVEDNAPIIPVRNPNSSQGKMTFGFDKPEEKRG